MTRHRAVDDGVRTKTSADQGAVERSVAKFFASLSPSSSPSFHLMRQRHGEYLARGVGPMSSGYTAMDASRMWYCYWCLHGQDVLGRLEDVAEARGELVEWMRSCQSPRGGFGGGPQQLPHLATTYAATMALCILGAFDVIDRRAMLDFLLSVKQDDGSFRMHDDGEVDLRASYCALSVAQMLNLLTPELTARAGDFVLACQTYEGGLGALPGLECHGGYAFCGLAALTVLGETGKLDLDAFAFWLSRRQMTFEGGFSGRSNKLVDGCYSWWIGGCFPLLKLAVPESTAWKSWDPYALVDAPSSDEDVWEDAQSEPEDGQPSEPTSTGDLLFDQLALQHYIVLCCQQMDGGLRDKPEKNRDHYHSCYCLSGLSVAQTAGAGETAPPLFGVPENRVRPVDPVFNICTDRADAALAHYACAESIGC